MISLPPFRFIFHSFVFAVFMLGSAYILEFAFHYKPCIMCLYERVPYIIMIVMGMVYLTVITLRSQKAFATLKPVLASIMLCCIVASVALSVYHIGIEQGIIEATEKCNSAGELTSSISIEDLKNAFSRTKLSDCRKPEFVLLGISLVGYNLIFNLVLLLVSAVSFVRRRRKEFTN